MCCDDLVVGVFGGGGGLGMVKCPNWQLFFKCFDFRCYYFDSRLILIYLIIRNLMWDLVFFFFGILRWKK